MPYNTFPQVQDIINGTSQDVRNQLSSTASSLGQPILIDYTNRIHKQVLRFSRWGFLRSDRKYFITVKGQSKYWVGPSDAVPPGTVNTNLNLQDVDKIAKDSVIDISNNRQLKSLNSQPYGPTLNDMTGSGRPGFPATYRQNPNNPNLLEIYPPPDNQNTNTPTIQQPITQYAAGGALANRTYYVKTTYVDSLGGESASSASGTEQFIPLNNLITVVSPMLVYPITSTGVQYGWFNVYIGTQEGGETKQNNSPIPVGTNWTEPTTGLITTGASTPTNSTLQQFGAYLVKFEYFKNRATLTNPSDYLQVPEDYKDVVIQGVNALAFSLLGKKEEAGMALQVYRSGLTEMVWDKNLFPEGVEFIRPDAGTFVNQQILGYLPPFF